MQEDDIYGADRQGIKYERVARSFAFLPVFLCFLDLEMSGKTKAAPTIRLVGQGGAASKQTLLEDISGAGVVKPDDSKGRPNQ